MAKAGEANIVEQHVEKGVLLASVLLFVYVLFHWVLSSPRRIDGVPPDQIDAQLRQKADLEIERVKRVEPKKRTLWPVITWVKELQENPFPSDISVANMGYPSRALGEVNIDIGDLEVALADLRDLMPAPGTPLAWAGRELPYSDTPVDVVASHVVAVYPYGELMKRWSDKLRSTAVIPNVVFVAVLAERREQNPDGGWGPPQSVKMVAIPAAGRTGVEERPYIPPYDPDKGNAEAVREALVKLGRDVHQKDILQPEYYDIWSGGSWENWRIHLPATSVSRSVEAIARRVGADIGRGLEERRLRPPGVRRVPPSGRGLTEAEMRRLEEEMVEEEPPGPVPPPREVTPPGRARPAPAPAPGQPPVLKQTLEPSLREQQRGGLVLVWLHDNSLVSAKGYQYRVRLVVASPLLTYPDSAKDPADARVATVLTPWSPWSATVSVPKATEFFLTGRGLGSVKLTVFAHSLGQRVMRGFTVTPGEPIGEAAEIQVINPIQQLPVKRTVDFSTGAVPVEFDFDKRILVRNIPKVTVEMLYLDDAGRLQRAILVQDMDRDSPQYQRYRQLRDEAREAEKAVTTASRSPP